MIRTLILILAVIGLIDASYLTYVQFAGADVIPMDWLRTLYLKVHADPQYTNFPDVIGLNMGIHVPLPFLGLAAYSLMFLMAYMDTSTTRKIALLMSAFCFMFSVRLMYVQLGIIGVLCPFCALSAATMTTLFILNLARYLRLRVPTVQAQPALA